MPLYSSNRKRVREDPARPSSVTSFSKGGGFNFDVFLSFRGEDTRGRFTSHLFKELNQRGISAFIDSEGLQKGERISELSRYMEASQVFVPILSKNYAESKWCLMEAAKMLEIHEADEENRWIIPVFHDVSPSDIKYDTGSFQASITEEQKKGNLDKERAEKYRCILRSIGQIAGYSLIADANGDEAKLCTMIGDQISSILKHVPFGVQPIGIDSQINEGNNSVLQGIILNTEEGCDIDLSSKAFEGMSNLRLLRLNVVSFEEFNINHFPMELKWLEWRGCELETLLFGHRFKNLVILNLSQSNIKQLQWGLKNFYRLKVLDLSHCRHLKRTPNFDCIVQLEKLHLDGCSTLNEVDASICHLTNLTILSMKDCTSLEQLPNLSGLLQDGKCSMSNMSKLEELNLQGCERLQSLAQLPSSLKRLLLQGCKMLKIVHGFENLVSIELLDMDECEGINHALIKEGIKFGLKIVHGFENQGKDYTH